MVSGAVEAGETGWGAALREIEEETGLVPDRFYSADVLERFYRPDIDCVVLVPVFVGFLDADREVRLSREHDAFQWIGAEEADRYLLFENQRSAIRHIERRFVREEPTELLRIDTGRTKRTRRGKLRKAREGKVVGTHAARYGFKFNATKDAYEVHEAEMRVVRRIFEMIGAEGKFLRSVANKLE